MGVVSQPVGDIIIGEPDATIAFAGKRVIEEVMKIEVPEGVQEAEYLGSLDSIGDFSWEVSGRD